MGFQRAEAGSGPLALPADLLAQVEETARRDGISPQEALERLLPAWQAQRDAARKAPPPSTTSREHFPTAPADSDRSGTDIRP